MLAPTGPLIDIEQIERAATERAKRQGPIECEISQEPASWYLVETFPNEEMRVMRRLAKRKFGAFRPMQQRRDPITCKRRQGLEAVFPGWVLVFIWNLGRNGWRVTGCPGVRGIFRDPVTLKPVAISDAFIDKLRGLGWDYEDTNAHALKIPDYQKPKKKRARLDKRNRKALAKLKKKLRDQGLWDPSTFEKLKDLEPHKRIAVLQHAAANGAALTRLDIPRAVADEPSLDSVETARI